MSNTKSLLLWQDKLEHWKSGKYLQKPPNITQPFFWRTSICNSELNLEYQEEFVKDSRLSSKKPNLETFKKYLEHKKNKNEKYAISFPNLSGDTILVIPKPKNGKNYTNLHYFMLEASKLQQKQFWKRVASEIEKKLKVKPYVFVSTHGLGVDYLHVRICDIPKYYEKSKLQKIPKKIIKNN
jgi:hypothetical protein